MLFGYTIKDQTPKPHSYRGQNGWWSVPKGWNVDATSDPPNVWASPNADYIPKYNCLYDLDGTLVFLDLARSLAAGL